MTLLDEIITGASGDVSVSMLLRQLKVVASRTGSDRLADWVDWEMNGYPPDGDVPDYRGPFPTLVFGDFYGFAGSGVKNYGIPPITFPAEMRDSPLFTLTFYQSIAEIEDWAREDHFTLTWPTDAIQMYNALVENGAIQRIVREDMALAQVKRPITRSVMIGVLDAVRNRVLNLALELDRVAPQAGQPGAPDETRSNAASVINHYNFGTSSNIAIGSSHVTQTVQLPEAGDRDGLLRYLGAAGLDPRLVVDLGDAIQADAQDVQAANDYGPRVKQWLEKVTGQIGTGVVTGTAIAALKAYFGF
ncbi:MAG: hypothetical protein JO246_12720 [Frankiaceae bacterium]|nr:hypothetical protein [Frankiaceae bacterium]MBV9872380.1 hypothetical protein [Frankiaceae bacterium]